MIATPGAPRICLFVTAAILFTCGRMSAGQDPETPAKEDDRARLIERWTREVAEYRLVADTAPETVLALKSAPALRWTNPVRETDGGLVFLWLGHDRPEAVSCFYRVRFEGRLVEAHEFVSLAPVGLTATLRGRTVWAPPARGLEPRPIPGAPRPAESASERLRQLRALAREFRVTVDVDTGPTELRLLPQPVATFGQEAPDAKAGAELGARRSVGALFAFVLATDPEAWLVIDERPGTDERRWEYAFARMSSRSLNARHKNQPVWDAPRDRDDQNPAKAYCVRWDVGPRS